MFANFNYVNCGSKQEGHCYITILMMKYVKGIGGLQPSSRDTDNNAAMYNCWWTNKRS